MTTTTECYVCGHGPHATREHEYVTWREMELWAAAQPGVDCWAPECDESLRFPGED